MAEVEGSQQPIPAPTPAPTVVKGIRTVPITAASILSLLVGIGNVILALFLLGFAVFSYSIIIAENTNLNMIEDIVAGLLSTVYIGILLLSVAIFHMLGWHWLWGNREKGGVVGVLAGTIDVIAVIIVTI